MSFASFWPPVDSSRASDLPDGIHMYELDPRTPVIIGIGQISERDSTALSATDLAVLAVQRALSDAGGEDSDLIDAIDTVGVVRPIALSRPGPLTEHEEADDFPRSVVNRVGAHPFHIVLEVSGDHSPQLLVTDLAASIAAGSARVALVFGAEAGGAVQPATTGSRDRERTGNGEVLDHGFGLNGVVTSEFTSLGLTDPVTQLALLENARRQGLGLSRSDYDEKIGGLLAPFVAVAADHPNAAGLVELSATEIVTDSASNRPVADPYRRQAVANERVSQGAAVLLASVEGARQLGVPEDKWVFIHGYANTRERPVMDRPVLSETPGAAAAARLALETAGVTNNEIATWDFGGRAPFPILAAAVDGLGLAPDDARHLTVTGGQQFFGSPGNNYALHAIATTVATARNSPNSFGFVGASGGAASQYSAAVYSTTPREWMPDRSWEIERAVDQAPTVPQVSRAHGWATIETYTIEHDSGGNSTGFVIARLVATGERFVAKTLDDESEMTLLLRSGEPIGHRVWAMDAGSGNRVTLGEPGRPAPAGLQDRYEFARVEKAGHLLVVTIDRPDARNALYPPGHEELEQIFDAFYADPELWVAIITGAGDKAFSAGNDLVFAASGDSNYLPASGFAGLTHRRGMNKPVIAAVNGYAMGGGFEAALACHIIVADETAKFALSEVRVGLAAGAGGIVRLHRAMPEKVANELILTGRFMDVHEAHRLGIVSRVVPAGTALDGARELAAELLANSPTSIRVSLEILLETADIPDTVEAVNNRSAALDNMMASADAWEGPAAFAAKRAPRWKNV